MFKIYKLYQNEKTNKKQTAYFKNLIEQIDNSELKKLRISAMESVKRVSRKSENTSESLL